MANNPKKQELNSQLGNVNASDKFQSLLDCAGVMFVEMDTRGIVTLINKKTCEVFGYSESEMLGKNWFENFLPERIREDILPISKKLLSGEIESTEYYENPILTKNKEEKIIYWHNALIKDANGKVVGHLSSGEDITEGKRAEQRLQESEHNLKAANATKDKFFSIIAHDLSSPFNAIIGFSNLLLQNHAEYGVQQRENLIKLISESSKSTLDLLENLLKWARTQTGEIKFNPNLFTLEEIILVTFEQVKEIAYQKNIQLAYDVDKKILVKADEAMLETVLRNLLSNAIKFTPKNGNIEVIATEKDESLTVSVKDNGMGIKKEKLKTLFTSVENESTRGTENEKGHGLGLILCKEFIEKHGGIIFVESEEGAGSTFSFIIPSGLQKAELN